MRKVIKLSILAACLILGGAAARAQTSVFTYQGKLNDAGSPANGQYDFTFRLFSVAGGGSQIGADVVRGDVQVTNGVFTVNLDFGPSPFTSATGSYLEILVRPGASTGTFTLLAPRQLITSSPYSVKSLNAENATNAAVAQNALQLGGVGAGQFVQTNDTRLSDARNPLPNSPSYINNTTSPQISSNFNISGNGTIGGTLSAATVNAGGFYSIAGLRVLSVNGPFNDGNLNYPATNTFAGDGAGISTIPDVPINGPLGKFNSFFGAGAGKTNTSGFANSFFGTGAGEKNTTGLGNSFFGQFAGYRNTTGSNNSFFGVNAGNANMTGGNNSFFGVNSGVLNGLGSNNSFFGVGADFSGFNSVGSDNTVLGYGSKITLNLSNQTALGSRAFVTQSNSMVLGSINGTNGATADTNVGIGTTAPNSKLHVSGTGIIRARINSDSNAGLGLALNEQSNWSVATVSPGHFQIFNDRIGQNALFISTFDNSVGVGTLNVSGIITVTSLGNAGSTALCRNSSNQISLCSSSLRYKTNIAPFSSGLSFINRLRPITFDWKEGGLRDVGFGAEEVARVNPLFVSYNQKGEVEGVKYDRLSAVFVNAFKEQQAQIEEQQKQLAEQQKQLAEQTGLIRAQKEKIEQAEKQLQNQRAELEALKTLVCSTNPAAALCRGKN